MEKTAFTVSLHLQFFERRFQCSNAVFLPWSEKNTLIPVAHLNVTIHCEFLHRRTQTHIND